MWKYNTEVVHHQKGATTLSLEKMYHSASQYSECICLHAECRYAVCCNAECRIVNCYTTECHNAECRIFIIMVSVVVLSAAF
jgi:hypothetical protein